MLQEKGLKKRKAGTGEESGSRRGGGRGQAIKEKGKKWGPNNLRFSRGIMFSTNLLKD